MKRYLVRRRKPRPGFSVVEALVAMTVLAVMLLTLISVLLYGYGAVAQARQVALATQVVQRQVETVRTLPFDSIAALGSTFNDASLAGLIGATGFMAVESGPGIDIKKVTVGVRWTYRGAIRDKKIVTYMTRKGINRI